MSTYLTETLTFGELIDQMNEIRQRLYEAGKFTVDGKLPAPAAEFAALTMTIRTDPHTRYIDALINVHSLTTNEYFGTLAARDMGDREASLMLMGYYKALATCIKMEGVDGPGGWAEALEADTPESEALQDMVRRISFYYNMRLMDAEGK